MKRIQTVLLAILLFAVCALPILAASPYDVTATVSTEEARRGEEVTFTVTLDTTLPDITDLSYTAIGYDAAVLGDLSGAWNITLGFGAAPGTNILGQPTTLNAGVLCTITFKVKDDAPLGTTEVSFPLVLGNASGPLAVQNISGKITVYCEHNYTAQHAAPEHLAEAATCTTAAKYYKSCTKCDGNSTNTFESGSALSHDWSTTYSQNASGHYRTCLRVTCGIDETPTPCSGGTATCSAQAICSTCLNPYGSTLAHDFANGAWVTTDDHDHWKMCAFCPAEDTANKSAHEYTVYTSLGSDTHSVACECGRAGTPATESCSGGNATCEDRAICQYCATEYGTLNVSNHTATTYHYVSNYDDTHSEFYDCCHAPTGVSAPCVGGSATCVDKAVCEVCHTAYGALATDVHTKNTYIYNTNGDGTHQKLHECCLGVANASEPCSGGSATCVAAAVCQYCNTVYGTPNLSNHDFAATLTQGTDTHYYECSRCPARGSEGPHQNYGFVSNGDDTHTGACLVCGKPTTAESCSGGSATCIAKAICEYCHTEYGSTLPHDFDLAAWGYKAVDGHAHICKTAGCTAHDAVIPHTSGGAASYTQAEICTECQYVISPMLVRPSSGGYSHTHRAESKWTSNSTEHWHECVGCSSKKFDEAAHNYDGDCDAVCNTCSYIRTVTHNYALLKQNETEHWYECACGAEKPDSREAHNGGEATCTAKAKCAVCATEYGELAEHLYGETLNNDETAHWPVCVCGAKGESAEHAFVDGICSACGYEKPAEDTEEPETPETEPAVVPDDGADDGEDGIFGGKTLILVAIIALAVVGVGVVCYVAFFRKR